MVGCFGRRVECFICRFCVLNLLTLIFYLRKILVFVFVYGFRMIFLRFFLMYGLFFRNYYVRFFFVRFFYSVVGEEGRG